MNRTDRLSAIIIMLQSKKLITAKEISIRFNISLRTVYRDMKALCEAGVPIGAEAGFGYYLVEGYHLPPVMFTPEEAGAMLVAGKLADKFGDKSVITYFNLAIDKIKSVLPDNQKEYIGQIEGQVHVFHHAVEPVGEFTNNYITSIQKAMVENKCLDITYFAKYNKTSNSRLIEPLGLCFYGFTWHLIAFCHLRNNFRDFRLDRIKGMGMSGREMTYNKEFSISEYFQSSFENEEVFNVVIRVDKEKAPLLSKTKYYFGFYKELVTDNYVEMHFAVNEYEYISTWLMSFGDMVLEIHNEHVREIILQKVSELSSKYLEVHI